VRDRPRVMDPDESLRRARNEPVRLVTYDARWPQWFDAERDRLMACVGARVAGIAHFGSTAVPGMPAKPTIGLIAGLRDMRDAEALLVELLHHGYSHCPELDVGAPERRFLFRHADGPRTHHLHLVAIDAAAWRERIHFRDLLRSDARLRAAYAALKDELAATHAGDREAYTRGKAAFIRRAITSAAAAPDAAR